MGRNLKRVPVDFDWPIGKTWSGYVNPHPRHICTYCEGLGWSEDYNKLKDEWYGCGTDNYKPNPFRENLRYNASAWSNNLNQDDVDALIAADRLWDFTRIPLNDEQKEIVKKKIDEGGNTWLPFNNGYKPTAKEVNKWNLKTMGHDSINSSIVIKARLKREGKLAFCSHCNGSGEKWHSPKAKELWKNWEDYDPPTGDGYQLWHDTSEGSPISPVFKNLDRLSEWCAENATVFANEKISKDQWLQMFKKDNIHYKEGNKIFT